MKTLKHTIGNSFNASLTFRDQNDAVVDLTTVTITSEIRDAEHNLVSRLSVTKADQITNTGEFTLQDLNTSDWPEGKLFWDVRYLISGNYISTEKIKIEATKGVTLV